MAAKSSRDQLIIKTVVPLGGAFLVAAFIAVAAWTGAPVYHVLESNFQGYLQRVEVLMQSLILWLSPRFFVRSLM